MRVVATDVYAGQAVSVRVEGARVGVPTTLTLRWEMGSRKVTSVAVFICDHRGTVDPQKQSSMGGSYLGLDPRGLFWSARDSDDQAPDGSDEADDVTVSVEAVCGQDQVEATFRRLLIPKGVVESALMVGTTRAVLFSHEAGPAPAVLVLGGSGGGIATARRTAAFLAGRGFTTLALPYFAAPGLPDELELIPVESPLAAVDALLSDPRTLGPRIGVLGISRGSELALLTAAQHDKVGAVVGLVPSPYVWDGLRSDGTPAQSAWSLHGQPVPSVPDTSDDASLDAAVASANPHAFGPYMERSLALAGPNADDALIPLSAHADTMLVVAAQDLVWPSTQFLNLAHQAWPDTSRLTQITYPGVGHKISAIPTDPISVVINHLHDGLSLPMGGDPAVTAAVTLSVWDRVTEFFSNTLRQ